MRIYVAGSLDEAARVREVQDALVEDGHEIAHDWTRAGDVGLHDYASDPRAAGAVAAADLDAVLQSDAVVVVVPARGGRGLWVELGAALASAASRRVPEVLVLADDPGASAFLHHPLVRLLEDVPALSAALATPAPVEDLDQLLERLLDRDPGHPLRVGIDGYCGAGKTTLAGELVEALRARGRAAMHVDSDGFHHVRERRYRQGRDSARGYYEDAYDLDALADRVLRPLGPGGDRVVATAVHDLHTDEVLHDRTTTVARDAVVVFAATFVQRGALRALWDEVVWVDTDEATATGRGIRRDAGALGGEEAAVAAYASRYQAACRLYVAEERPRERASIILAPSGT